MMRNKKFIIGFLIFDAVAILVIVFVLLIHNPFAVKVAPEMEPTTSPTTQTNSNNKASGMDQLESDKTVLFHDTTSLVGMRETSETTSDGKYLTAYRAELDLDLDGDGEIESVSISLDDHSESFYILVNDGGNLMDYVVPGTEFTMRDQYGVKAFKGGLRGFSADLDKNDKYTEVGIEMMRDTWDEYKTIMVRYDGTKISASIVPGSLSAVNNAGAAQFSVFDPIYGVHKLYRTYSITSEVDFLKAQTEYFFTDTNVEKTSYMYNPDFNIQCTNLNGEACTITSGSLFYWSRTDYETYVDVISVDNLVYRLPITVEEYEYESGPQKVYKIGDHDAAEIKTR